MASTIDLATLLESLPACKRCRKNRRRCDTKLPSCANCSKAGVECIFYDHALQEDLPRSYIASLVEHLSQEDNMAAVVTPGVVGVDGTKNVAQQETVDNTRHHFAYAQGAYRYLGAGSHLLDVHRITGETVREPKTRPRPCPPFPSHVVDSIPRDLRVYLTQIFFETIHQVYPILNPSNPWLSLDNDNDTLPLSPTQTFIREMVCAVACHCEGDDNNRDSLHALGAAAHARALRHIEQATAAQAVSTLQVVVLLVLYTLVHPATGGNISQQLGFAIRLVIDLCESGSDGEDNGDDDERQQERGCSPPLTSLYKVIYCLENHVCGVLVRPTALPESTEPLVMPLFSSFSSSPPLLTLSPPDPLDLLCTLYRVQARCRNGGPVDSTLRRSVLVFAKEYQKEDAGEDSGPLHPNVAAVLGETCLVLEPTSFDVAIALIAAYNDPGYLATFLSAYWVHRAANVVVDALDALSENTESTDRVARRRHLMLAYGRAMALLQSWTGTWDAAGVLRQALEQRLEGESVP